jgi:hypothetical protein
MGEPMDDILYGKDSTQRVVGIEAQNNTIEVFIEDENGKVRSEWHPHIYWILSDRPLSKKWTKLDGDLFFKYARHYDNLRDFFNDRRTYKTCNTFSLYDQKEAAMLIHGITYFKGMKQEDVSVLSFDIEKIT